MLAVLAKTGEFDFTWTIPVPTKPFGKLRVWLPATLTNFHPVRFPDAVRVTTLAEQGCPGEGRERPVERTRARRNLLRSEAWQAYAGAEVPEPTRRAVERPCHRGAASSEAPRGAQQPARRPPDRGRVVRIVVLRNGSGGIDFDDQVRVGRGVGIRVRGLGLALIGFARPQKRRNGKDGALQGAVLLGHRVMKGGTRCTKSCAAGSSVRTQGDTACEA